MESVLNKIRVIDLSRQISGPFCSLLLADFGAEVIRVERPGGEEDRYMGLQSASGDAFMFLNQNRNKKAITLNFMNNEEAFSILMNLVKKSDVLIHNFSPGAVEKLGISYEKISAINPEIIYAEITGFGSTGPYSNRLGFDQIAQAMSGAMMLTGFPETPPQRAEARYCDYGTGNFGALGIVLALYHRNQTGKGQKVEANLMKTGVAMNAAAVSEYESLGKKRTRMGNRSWYTGPSDLYKTKDGRWVYISLVTRGLFTRWCNLVNRTDLLDRSDLATDYDRFLKKDEIDPIVKDWVIKRSADEVASELTNARLPYGFVYDIEDVAKDPQIQHEESLIDMECGKSGMVKLCGTPLSLSRSPGKVKLSPPRVEEHNKEIYCNLLGYQDDELAELKNKGVI